MVAENNQLLFELLRILEIVNFATSVVTNLLLIYLIIYRSSREIGTYRYLLLAFALNDIYFPVVHILALPVICSYKDAFVMFSHGILTSKFSICLFASSLDVNGKFRLKAFLVTMGFNSMMTLSMTIIIFCSLSIVFHFRNADVEWSCTTKRLQKRLFYILLTQMIIPMAFVYFPCAAIINLPMLGFRINVFPNLVSAALTVFPLVDGFIVLFGVTSYKNAVLHFLKRKPKGSNGLPRSTVNSSHRQTRLIGSNSCTQL